VAEGFLILESPISKNFSKYRIDAVCIVLGEDKKIQRINYYENLY
jgi:hypothetical protein